MKQYLKALCVVLLLIPIVGMHMALTYIAPFPLDKINIIFAFLILFILFNKSGAVVWISFLVHYLVELYATTTFGVIIFSGTMSILLVYWLSKNVFTNPRFVVAIGLSAMGLVLYRAVYALSLFLLYVLSRGRYSTGLVPGVIVLYLWELFFTTILVSIGYFIISLYRGKKAGILL